MQIAGCCNRFWVGWVVHVGVKWLTSVWKQEKRLTRKGWRVELATSKMRFSAKSDSTSSRAMMSPFFSALMAKYSPVLRYCARMTFCDGKGKQDLVPWRVCFASSLRHRFSRGSKQVRSNNWTKKQQQGCVHTLPKWPRPRTLMKRKLSSEMPPVNWEVRRDS